MNKPKILIMLSRFPYPVSDGTRYKILENVCAGLADDFDVEFFIVTWNDVKASDIEYLEKRFGKVHLWNITKAGFVLRSVQTFLTGAPFETSGFTYAPAQAWLREHAATYSGFYAHTIRMGEYARAIPRELRDRIVIEFNDAMSLNYLYAREILRAPVSWAYALEGWVIKQYEKALMKEFSRFHVVSPFDKEYLLSLSPNAKEKTFDVISHGVELPNVSPRTLKGKRAYFIGHLGYPPNRDALSFLVNDVWPLVIKNVPDAELLVVGAVDARTARMCRGRRGVVLAGFVNDLREAVSSCAFLAAPIRSGSGMPSKILEAFSFGIPVMTTPLGARGIAGIAESGGLEVVESKPERWADAVCSLLMDEDRSGAMGNKARAFAEEYLSVEAARKGWNRLFKNGD